MKKVIIILSILIADSFAQNACGKVLESGTSPADQQALVNAHNARRNLLNEGKVPGQPKAKGIPNVLWDDALARAAQDIANTCVFKHAGVNETRFYVGQNLLAWWSTGLKLGVDWDDFVEGWFKEYKDYTYPGPIGPAGHYTQVVWQNTIYVGCGYTMYTENKPNNYKKLLVCNYGPGGNYPGQPPYEI